ncbi:MAG: hypothetical protein ACI4XM_07100 [Candidatus Coprovivens sp.]
MREKYFESYSKLNIDDKRNVLLNEISETLDVIENLCIRNSIPFEKLNSNYYIKNRSLLFEEDYYNLMFIYITYLKEDIALLLEKSA